VDAHLWLAKSENVAQRLPGGRQDAACWKVLRPVRGLNPAEIIELPQQTAKQCSGQVKRIGAPSRIRTYDTRFRKPLLYPLSYGG
jgi:hypothetical protein